MGEGSAKGTLARRASVTKWLSSSDEDSRLGALIVLLSVGGALALTWSPGAAPVLVRVAASMLIIAGGLIVLRQRRHPGLNRVGELADVLRTLGEQLREANQNALNGDATILLESAEIELSVVVESTAGGGLSVNVVDVKASRNMAQTSTVKVTVVPIEDTLAVGN